MRSQQTSTTRRTILWMAWALAIPVIFSCNAVAPTATPSPVSSSTLPPSATVTTTPTHVPTPAGTPTLWLHSLWRTSHIAFASNRTGSFQIYIMRPDGSGLKQLTDSEGENTQPAWSLDAKHILFVSTRDHNEEIYSMDPDGSHQVNLTHARSKDTMPVWLPNSRIAFVSDRQGLERIVTMDPNGENALSWPRSSIDATSKMLCVVWYSENSLFYTADNGDKRTTRVLDTTKGETWTPRALAGTTDRSCPLVSTLVNSDWVMFVTNRDGHDEIYGYEENVDKDVAFTHGSEPSLGATRSSDQDWISFYSHRTGNWDIFIMGLTGKDQWNITNDPGDDIQPAWEPY